MWLSSGTAKMRSTLVWLLASTLLSWSATALPTTSDAGEKMIMQYHEIDLAAYEMTSNNTTQALEARKQVKVCGKTFEVSFDRCLSVGSFMSSIAFGVASLVSAKSDGATCTAESFENNNYQYAVRAKGNCHTTAQRETIEGAIEHYMDKEVPDSVCGVQCMKLTHGGNWQGYVVWGAPDYDWKKYLDMCATVNTLGHCESGGSKYIGVGG
ncbi:hypothetical protein Tdes44962_MAKER04385 [Teratosphaeria destructans]|uniref:Secreted protein CSS2 C-terminal domain-containing protein n=1 Tax=Teratosphaeria destructans TaxID=418781 RepID=A0A9W7W004_9PEZI|nr:hypothetical protein Tdes44962_MAKER04385 [Teratosphaeria destructans]